MISSLYCGANSAELECREKASKACGVIELEGSRADSRFSGLIEKEWGSITSLQAGQPEQAHISCDEAAPDVPVFLLTTFDKNRATGNLSEHERIPVGKRRSVGQ